MHHTRARPSRARIVSIGLAMVVAGTVQLGCHSPRPTGGPAASRAPTLVGVSVQPRAGEDYRAALAATEDRYGSVDVIRYFDPDLPNSWADIESLVGDHPVVVSFKAPPSEVLRGADDDYLRSWFAQAPRDKRTWWSYLPEPEDAVDTGSYTASDFRAAWRRIDGLATQADNPRLISTLTLMCYTLSPASGRDWHDFYPGGAYVDVMGWDCYNSGYRKRNYTAPADIFGQALRLSESLGKPWAIPETGSLLVDGDSGAGRARWITDLIDYARAHHAQFLTFFDADTGRDYRLHDKASQQALVAGIDGG